jgi:hypothetical protein
MNDLDPARSAGTRSYPTAATLADALEERTEELVTVWWRLGACGPTGQSDQAGDEDFARQRYLYPLARLLIGGLRDRNPHRPVYLDERLRYLPSGLDLAERAEFLGKRLAVEAEAISDLVAGSIEPQAACDLLADLHRPLTIPPAGDPLRLLLIGDAIFTEIRPFLVASELAHGRQLDVEHLTWGMVSHAGLSMEHVIDALTRRPPAAIGLSLFSFGAIAPCTRLLNEAHRMSQSQVKAAVADLMRLLQTAVGSIRQVTDGPSWTCPPAPSCCSTTTPPSGPWSPKQSPRSRRWIRRIPIPDHCWRCGWRCRLPSRRRRHGAVPRCTGRPRAAGRRWPVGTTSSR